MDSVKWRLLACSAGLILLSAAYYRIQSASVTANAARAFLASLTPEQREKAVFKFNDEERFFWHYVPSETIAQRYKRPRRGLPLREMTPAQNHLARALLSAGLSQKGFIKATTIMSLEDVLREMERDTGERRNPEKYFFSVFGDPSEKGTWGYRVEGHHVSVHITVVDGKVSGSPTFLGANPAEVREGPRRGLRVLSKEEDLARGLLSALDAKQKAVAIVSADAYPDILTAADRKAALKGQPSGLSAAQMTAPQRGLLQAVLEEYASNLPDDVAQARLEQIRQAGTNLLFAWAGTEKKGGPHYYRIQAPKFLVEYDNTQDNANHIHSVWRDFSGDWGQDLLAEHYKTNH